MKVESNIKLDGFSERLRLAQQKLNEQVAGDCEPYTPMQNGESGLRGSVRYPKGLDGGEIMWDTPYAHYQYMGEVYGPNIPKRDEYGNIIGFWSPPEKYPTGRRLTYSEPGTGDHWFERAKAEHKQEWIDLVKKELTNA